MCQSGTDLVISRLVDPDLVVCEALVDVEVEDEEASGPLEADHFVVLVFPRHVGRTGTQPTVLVLSPEIQTVS